MSACGRQRSESLDHPTHRESSDRAVRKFETRKAATITTGGFNNSDTENRSALRSGWSQLLVSRGHVRGHDDRDGTGPDPS